MAPLHKNIAMHVWHTYYRARISRPVFYLLNLRSQRRFKRSKRLLSPADARMVDEVSNNGYAVRFLGDFFEPDTISKI
jgi:hypothetical protein